MLIVCVACTMNSLLATLTSAFAFLFQSLEDDITFTQIDPIHISVTSEKFSKKLFMAQLMKMIGLSLSNQEIILSLVFDFESVPANS